MIRCQECYAQCDNAILPNVQFIPLLNQAALTQNQLLSCTSVTTHYINQAIKKYFPNLAKTCHQKEANFYASWFHLILVFIFSTPTPTCLGLKGFVVVVVVFIFSTTTRKRENATTK